MEDIKREEENLVAEFECESPTLTLTPNLSLTLTLNLTLTLTLTLTLPLTDSPMTNMSSTPMPTRMKGKTLVTGLKNSLNGG